MSGVVFDTWTGGCVGWPCFSYLAVSDEQAMLTTRRLAAEEGIFGKRPSEPSFYREDCRRVLHTLWLCGSVVVVPRYTSVLSTDRRHHIVAVTHTHTAARMISHALLPCCVFFFMAAGGFSGGANVYAALSVLKTDWGRGKTVVAVICDSGLKYLSTDLWLD